MSQLWPVLLQRHQPTAPAGAEGGAALRELEDRVERLALVCEALWTLLRDKAGVAEEELVQRVVDLDLTDGRLDGKASRQGVRTCPSCARPVGKRFDRCLYCQTPTPRDPFS